MMMKWCQVYFDENVTINSAVVSVQCTDKIIIIIIISEIQKAVKVNNIYVCHVL